MAIDFEKLKTKAAQKDAATYAAQKADFAKVKHRVSAPVANNANDKATAAQIKANPSMLTAKITPITMAQTAAGVANGSIPNAFQNQKESGIERAADTISSGALSLVGGAANAVRLATTGKYSPTGIISRGIDKIRGTNYTEQNAANQKLFADEMMDKSRLYSQNAKRGLGKFGQAGVDIGSAATQIGLMALTGNAAGALGAGSEATGALTKGLMAIQQGGQGAYDAEKAGAGEGTQALYGLLQGATVYATEGISNVGALGKVFGNGVADSKIEQASAKAISKFIKSDVGRAAANRLATGAEAGIGEALEQNIQDALTPVYQRLTYDKNAKLNAEDMIYNGLVAGAVGGIVGSAGKNNLKALETENDAKAAERLNAAKNAPTVTNTAPNLSQVAPNLVRPSQNIAQKAAQAPTVNESAKEVKLPAETENALKTQPRAPETKTNIFPENSIGAKITNDMPQGTSSTGKNSVVETIDPATAKPAELRKAVDGNPNLSEEFIKSTLNESRRNLTNTERQNDEVWFGYNKDFYDKYMPSLPVEAFLQAQYRGDVSPFPDYKFRGTMWPEWEGILTGKSSGGFWSGNPAGYIQSSGDRVVLVTNATDTGNKKYRANREDNGRYKLDEIVAVYTFNEQTRKWENIYTKNGVDVSELMGRRHEHTSAANQTNFFPADSLGAKITTPKSNIPLKTGETSKSETPNAVGAKSAEFGYKEAPTQNRFAENTFTKEEVSNTPALENTHKVNPDAYVDRNAQERYDSDYEGEKADLFGSKQKWDDADTKLAIMILENETAKARKTGEWGEVAKLNKKYAAIGTTWGQEGRQRQRFANTPTEIISDAAETLFGENTRKLSDEDKNNIMKSISDSADKLDNIKQGDTASVVSLIKDLNKIRKTTGLFGKETSTQMSGWLDYASKLPDGEAFLRDVAAQQIRNVASDYQKTSVLNAIKNYRVMGMLSKLTTILRNLTANNIFDPIESLSTNAGVPLDILLSKYTKTRSTSVDKSWFSSAKRKGSIDGFVKSAIQVGLDADVTNSSSKYETRSGRTFKMTGNPVERFLSTWAKWENYGLQSTDEFQKGGIAAETQRGIDQLKSKGLVAKDALTGRAEEVAKQRTFQNDGALATAMLKGRDALNVFSVKDKRGGSLGAGDVAVPFAKVPANIVAQGGNYSPAGFIKAIGNLGKTLAQAHEGTLTADQQAKAVMDFGRATTGSAGIAMFTALALKGIIKVAGADDKDKEALQTSEGQNGTQFNVSALNRWIEGKPTEWQDGDTLISIGFLEPINAQMAMGAMIADAYKDDGKVGLADVANANVSSVFQSVLDLPAMSQISDLVNGYKYSSADTTSGKLSDAALGYGASQAASFLIPNIVGGVATGMDGTVRNTYTSKNPLKQATDSIVSKIPGLRNTLPAKQDIYGNDRQNTGNKLLDTLNANILPGQIGKYRTSEVNQELYRLDTKYPVRNAPNTIKSNKLTYALTLDEKAKYLKTMGQTENSLMQAMISSSAYKSMTDTQKSDALNNLMLYAQDKANREFVTSKGAKYTSEKLEKVYEAEQQGVSPTGYFTYKTKLGEISDDDTVTELEAAQALEKTNLSQSEKGKLWQNQNVKFSPEKNPYSGTLAQKGLAPSKTIEIMEAFSTIDDAIGKNYVKADKGPSAAQVKAAYLNQWLTRQGYNANQRADITDVFTTWQMIKIDKPSKKATQFVSANPMP